MKKHCLVITLVTSVLLIALTLILPETIPVHFGVSGAGPAVNKFYILLFIPVPALIYWAVIKKQQG